MTHPRYFRLVSVVLALTMIFEASAAVIHSAGSSLLLALQADPPEYTDTPGTPYVVPNPARDEATRNGIWDEQGKYQVGQMEDEFIAEMALARTTTPNNAPENVPLDPGAEHTKAKAIEASSENTEEFSAAQSKPSSGDEELVPHLGEISGGEPYPWEASFPGGGSNSVDTLVNSNNGNRLTSIPLVSVPGSKGPSINLVLHHNSRTTNGTTLDSLFGPKWSFNYDATLTRESVQFGLNIGNLITVRWGNGKVVPFRYDPNRDLANTQTWYPPDGFYDIVRPGGVEGGFILTTKHGTKYLFSPLTTSNTNFRGALTKITDRHLKSLTITREANSGRLEKITDSATRSVSFGYNVTKQVWQLKDCASPNNFWTFSFDAGRLWKINYPIGPHGAVSRIFGYNANHCITSETDLRGKVWTCEYDSDNRLTRYYEPGVVMTGGYPGYQFIWTDPAQSTMKDPYLRTEVHKYSNGRISKIVDEAGFEEVFMYDPTRKISWYDGKLPGSADTWNYALDAKGNVLTETSPMGEHSYATYDTDNTVLTTSDDLTGSTMKYEYLNGSLKRVYRDWASSQLNYSETFYTDGAPSSSTVYGSSSTNNQNYTFGYDSWGQINSITDPKGTTNLTVDTMGRYKQVKNQLQKFTDIIYDTWGRPTKVKHPSVGGVIDEIDIEYDAESNVTKVIDERDKEHTWIYDDLGQVTSYTNAKTETEQYWYSATGFLEKVRNGRGYDRIYKPTVRDEVVQLDMPDGSKERWQYKATGDVSTYTAGYLSTTPITNTYTYDNDGRPLTVVYPAGTPNVTFTYPAPSGTTRTVTMADGSGTTTWTYDALGNLTSLNQPQGNITYGYSTRGHRTSMTDATGTTLYDYDNLGRLSKLTNPHSEITEWLFDNAGRMEKRKLGNGTFEEVTYDERNRPKIIKLKNSATTILRQQTYGYDKASNVLSHAYLNGTTTAYEYDNINQLTREYRGSSGAPTWEQTYSYDANGNRATRAILGQGAETYANDAGDKLTSVTATGTLPSKTFTYDNLGRRKTMVTGGVTTTYNWDAESRIASITKPGVPTNTFVYNALDTRVSKTDTGGTRTYRRDGASVTSGVLADGAATYTPGVSEKRAGTSRYLHSGIKNADSQSNTSQAVESTNDFDAFGNVIGTPSAFQGPFKYGGGFGYQEDSDHGLKLLGHRYYDPSVGRFLSRDPISSGNNWYTYCRNSPILQSDATGFGPDWLNWKNGLSIGGAIVGGLIGGPIGAAVGTGLGRALGGLIEGEALGEALVNGVIEGVISYVGGKLFVGIGKALQKAGGKIVGRLVSLSTKRALLASSAATLKKGLTAAGRALTKQAQRNPALWGKLKGGTADLNKRAADFLEALLNNPASKWGRVYSPTRGEYLVEVVDPKTGLGATWTEGGTFVGFRDPPLGGGGP